MVGSCTSAVEQNHPDETRQSSRRFVLLFRTRQVHIRANTRFDELRRASLIRVSQSDHDPSLVNSLPDVAIEAGVEPEKR